MTQTTFDESEILRQPLRLPCGVVLKNRLAKSAMSDSLGDGRGNPTPAQSRLYERWAEGGCALSIIGEVQATPLFPEKPGNLVLGPTSDPEKFAALAARGAAGGAQIWPQLGHAGALAHAPISRPEGPSALAVGELRCAEMPVEAVRAVPDMIADAAGLAKQFGFGGVQIHAAHGFLLSQFLSPLFNRREDGYGGSIEARCRIVTETVERVRERVGPAFPVALKINATDSLEGGLTEEESLEALRLLDATSLDLIDISGGTYFPGARASSDGAGGGPYFLDFAARARAVTKKPLMVTGGFKTRAQAAGAVASGAADMVGLARAFALDPAVAAAWLAGEDDDPAFPRFATNSPGGVTAWYTMRLTALAEGREEQFSLDLEADFGDLEAAVRDYDERDAARCEIWRGFFHAA